MQLHAGRHNESVKCALLMRAELMEQQLVAFAAARREELLAPLVNRPGNCSAKKSMPRKENEDTSLAREAGDHIIYNPYYRGCSC